MSKLSASLKSLINAAHARPGPIPSPPHMHNLFAKIEREAAAHKLGRPSWLALTTATTMTMNSPEAMRVLFETATENAKPRDEGGQDRGRERHEEEKVVVAEIMREVGLKCIGFNGVPRTINMLNSFRAALPSSILPYLNTTPTRHTTPSNISSINDRGRSLWTSVYASLAGKLESKLADAHPDLPVFIIGSEYGALFSDPPRASPSSTTTTTTEPTVATSDPNASNSIPPTSFPTTPSRATDIGRVTTSLVAIACLRAQQGVGPQVLSHVFGLRRAWEDGSWKSEAAVGEEEGVRWLVSDEGCMWVLEKVDEVVEALGRGEGSTFAPVRAKL